MKFFTTCSKLLRYVKRKSEKENLKNNVGPTLLCIPYCICRFIFCILCLSQVPPPFVNPPPQLWDFQRPRSCSASGATPPTSPRASCGDDCAAQATSHCKASLCLLIQLKHLLLCWVGGIKNVICLPVSRTKISCQDQPPKSAAKISRQDQPPRSAAKISRQDQPPRSAAKISRQDQPPK